MNVSARRRRGRQAAGAGLRPTATLGAPRARRRWSCGPARARPSSPRTTIARVSPAQWGRCSSCAPASVVLVAAIDSGPNGQIAFGSHSSRSCWRLWIRIEPPAAGHQRTRPSARRRLGAIFAKIVCGCAHGAGAQRARRQLSAAIARSGDRLAPTGTVCK